jgi:hypothetical protein
MVHINQERMLRLCQLQQLEANQRSLCQIERFGCIRTGPQLNLFFLLFPRNATEICFINWNMNFFSNLLNGFTAHQLETCAQDFVPTYDFVQTPAQRTPIQYAFQTDSKGNVVSCASRFQLIKNP